MLPAHRAGALQTRRDTARRDWHGFDDWVRVYHRERSYLKPTRIANSDLGDGEHDIAARLIYGEWRYGPDALRASYAETALPVVSD
jgi:hypothetical protein